MANQAKKLSKQQKKTIAAKKSKIHDLLATARMHHEAGRWPQAEIIYRQALNRDPGNDLALSLLAKLLMRKPDYQAAERLLAQAIRLNPKQSSYHSDLSDLYIKTSRWDMAIDAGHQALRHDSANVFAYYHLAVGLHAKRQYDDAIAAFRQALRINPDFTGSYCGICKTLTATGNRAELSAHLEDMEQLFVRANENDQMHLAFELGIAFDGLDEYDKAFRYMDIANTIKMKPYKYLIDKDIEYLENIIATFDAGYFQRYANCGLADDTPIFIVGMPRSGTSLIEQILSSHPDVFGGGELDYLPAIINSYNLQELQCPDFQTIGRSYMQVLRQLSDRKHITDKRPLNYVYAGLISLALPRAKIIHCQRNPVDTCFSCFKQHFTGHYFSNNLNDLGKYYLAYEKVMNHWQEVMPEKILTVRYEDMVNNLPGQVQFLLEFCGLPWDEDCLNFYQSKRIVGTASQDQVRKPIYSSSVDRWRRYEKQLQPLLAALNYSDTIS